MKKKVTKKHSKTEVQFLQDRVRSLTVKVNKMAVRAGQVDTLVLKFAKRLSNIDVHTIEPELDKIRASACRTHKSLNKDAKSLHDILAAYIARSSAVTQTTWYVKNHHPEQADAYCQKALWAYDTMPPEFWTNQHKTTTIAEWIALIQNAYNDQPKKSVDKT